MKRIWWIALSIGLLVPSAIAVLVRLSGYYYVPQPIGHALDSFVGPGEFIWWVTGSGVLAARVAARALRNLNLSKR